MQKLPGRYEAIRVDSLSILTYNELDMDYISKGYRQLACSILLQAMTDWRTYSGKKKPRDRRMREFIEWSGFPTPRKELLSFFYSGGCQGLCCCVDIDYEEMLKKIGGV